MEKRKETLPMRVVQTPQQNGTYCPTADLEKSKKKLLTKSQNNERNRSVKTTTFPIIQNDQTNIL
jgi:hypothetical protein